MKKYRSHHPAIFAHSSLSTLFLLLILALSQSPSRAGLQDPPQTPPQDRANTPRRQFELADWERELSHPIPHRRAVAAQRLAELEPSAPSTIDRLILACADVDVDVRVQASYALSQIQGHRLRALESLASLLQDPNEHVRYSAEWSIAHIARTLQEQEMAESPNRLQATFKQILDLWAQTPPHPLHRIAVELAHQRFVQTTNPNQHPTRNQPSSSASDPLSQNSSLELARASYLASDTLGRIRFAHQLSDPTRFPSELRQLVIAIESQTTPSLLLDTIVDLWGNLGQQELERSLLRHPPSTLPKETDLQAIILLEPQSKAMVQRLLRWAQIPSSTDASPDASPLRLAAIQALAKTNTQPTPIIQALLPLLHDTDENVALETISTLSRLNPNDSELHTTLTQLSQASASPAVQLHAVTSLARIAPTSQETSKAIADLLLTVQPDDDRLVGLLEAFSQTTLHDERVLPLLPHWLGHDSPWIRIAAAQALQSCGSPIAFASDHLLNHIFDPNERIAVKQPATRALGASLPDASAQLIARANRLGDESSLESALHAIALLKEHPENVHDWIFSILRDASHEPATRAAAAEAIGILGSLGRHHINELLAHIDPPEPEEVQAACLIASSQVQGSVAYDYVQQHLDAHSPLVQVAARYALHLCGDSQTSFQALVALIDGSDTDDSILQSLQDIGPPIHDACYHLLEDANALAPSRLICAQVLCLSTSPDWQRLFLQLNDDSIGDALASHLQYSFPLMAVEKNDASRNAFQALISCFESGRMTQSGQGRLAYLLQPDGLGAGDEDEEWGNISVSRSSIKETWLRKSQDLERLAEPVAAMEPSPPSEMLPSDEPTSETPLPKRRIPEEISQSTPADPITENLREVEVLYGTNRARQSPAHSMKEVVLTILLATGTSVCVLLGSMLVLARGGYKTMAFATFATTLIVGPLGLFAASQLAKQSWNDAIAYSGEFRNRIEYGRCLVTIPPIHQKGELEGVNLFTIELKPDPQKHIVLKDVQVLTQDSFFNSLQALEEKKGKNLLVFIHGYNVAFEDAARRTAQMAFDLDFPGAPVFYSWPSQANWYRYGKDRESIQQSVQHIRQFLVDLGERSGADTINLVAHSMGNVGLTEALKEIELAGENVHFNQVVLAAPDIDADIFKEEIAPWIVKRANRMTLYTSSTDLALIASRYFNEGPRVGDSGSEVILFPGIETIDATSVDSSLLGHSYYGSNVTVLSDLGNLLRNQALSQRQYLRPVGEMPNLYWEFDPVRLSQSQEPPLR